jgi:hypothetical protein
LRFYGDYVAVRRIKSGIEVPIDLGACDEDLATYH